MHGQGWRGQWPSAPKTNDGTIPHKLFLFLLSQIGTLAAGRELEMVNATSMGVANAFSGKDDKKIQHSINTLKKAAYPVRYD